MESKKNQQTQGQLGYFNKRGTLSKLENYKKSVVTESVPFDGANNEAAKIPAAVIKYNNKFDYKQLLEDIVIEKIALKNDKSPQHCFNVKLKINGKSYPICFNTPTFLLTGFYGIPNKEGSIEYQTEESRAKLQLPLVVINRETKQAEKVSDENMNNYFDFMLTLDQLFNSPEIINKIQELSGDDKEDVEYYDYKNIVKWPGIKQFKNKDSKYPLKLQTNMKLNGKTDKEKNFTLTTIVNVKNEQTEKYDRLNITDLEELEKYVKKYSNITMLVSISKLYLDKSITSGKKKFGVILKVLLLRTENKKTTEFKDDQFFDDESEAPKTETVDQLMDNEETKEQMPQPKQEPQKQEPQKQESQTSDVTQKVKKAKKETSDDEDDSKKKKSKSKKHKVDSDDE